MGLPKWKNLPRLSKAKIAVTDYLKNATSMSMDEGKTQLLHDESPSFTAKKKFFVLNLVAN